MRLVKQGYSKAILLSYKPASHLLIIALSMANMAVAIMIFTQSTSSRVLLVYSLTGKVM